MPVTTLFGIPITDRASRLIAADCAEERGLGELAAALRDIASLVVLESTDPPALLPEITTWTMNPPPLRQARGLLQHLMNIDGYHLVELRIVPADSSPEVRAWRRYQLSWRRFELGTAEQGVGIKDEPTRLARTGSRTDDDFMVRSGVVLALLYVTDAEARLHFCAADAPRFGFGYVPAFPGE